MEDGTKKSLKLIIIKLDKRTFIPIHHLGWHLNLNKISIIKFPQQIHGSLFGLKFHHDHHLFEVVCCY